MARPESFRSLFWGINAVVCAVFCTVAVGCVLSFGQFSDGSITAYLLGNLDNSDHDHDTQFALLSTANTFASISVLLTYPLQMFPALQLIGPLLSRKPTDRGDTVPTSEEGGGGSDSPEVFHDDDNDDNSNNNKNDINGKQEVMAEGGVQNTTLGLQGDSPMLRLAYVMVTYLVAIIVPNVQLLISLVGAMAGSSTAILIPPLLELELLRRHNGSYLGRIRCYTMFAIGFVFFAIGTCAALVNIVRAYL